MRALALLLLTGVLAFPAWADPKITVGKDTTYVTAPLDKDGFVDFAAALNDLRGKGVTPDNNAAVAIWEALGPGPDGQPRPAAFFKRLCMKEPPADGDYFVALGPFLRDRLAIGDKAFVTRVVGQTSMTIRQPWTAREFPQLADWLVANEKPLDRIAAGVKRRQYFVPLVADDNAAGGLVGLVMGDAQRGRPLATALASRATLRMADGKPDAAWADVMACFRLARHLARKASLIEGLVAVAVDAIAQRAATALLTRPDVTAGQLAGYLRDLRALPPMPSVAEAYEGGERLVALDGFQSAVRTGARLAGVPGVPSNVQDLDADTLLRRANHFFDRLVVDLKEPDRRMREAALNGLAAELKSLSAARRKGGLPIPGETEAQGTARGVAEILIDLVIPAVRQGQTAVDRSTAGHQVLQVAFALAAYKRDHKDYPKTLAELVPKYLDKIPDDLFTGKPLVYRPSENAFLLYSLGPNGKDDDGRGPTDDPKGEDIAIRIPVPTPVKK
jgi:hypothetical protein